LGSGERLDWEVLLSDHHEGYLSWTEFERNQRLIVDNANSEGRMARGSDRRGESLRRVSYALAIAAVNCMSPIAARR
jgi:hypothetical protein